MKNKTKGFTLAEVLVGTLIAALVIIALVGLWISSVNYGVMAKNRNKVVENQIPSVALMMEKDLLEASVMMLSYMGYTNLDGMELLHLGYNFTASSHNMMTTVPLLINYENPRVVAYCLVQKRNSNGAGTGIYSLRRRERNLILSHGPLPAISMDIHLLPVCFQSNPQTGWGGFTMDVQDETLLENFELTETPTLHFSDDELFIFKLPIKLADGTTHTIAGEIDVNTILIRYEDHHGGNG